MAASIRRVSAASDLLLASNATLPLERTVVTSVKPAASKHRLKFAIFAFVGITPRSRAT
jgi:hypothetical protein